MSSAGVRFKDRQPRSHRWLRTFNLLAALAALASTLAATHLTGLPRDPESWFWAGLLAFLPAIAVGGLAFFALPRIKADAAAWCCGLFGIAASGFWAYAYREIIQSGDPNAGLAAALLPFSLLPVWAIMIVVVIALEWWWSVRTSRIAR